MLKKGTSAYDLITLKNLTGIALFVFSFLWFCFPGEYVLIANSDLTLFRANKEYLLSFLDRSGGLLDYMGSFLSQFFRFRIPGAILLAAVITAVYYLTGALLDRNPGKRMFPVFEIFASILFLAMHNFYPHQLSYSLGFILTMGLAAILPVHNTGKRRYLAIVLPLIYLVSGGFVWFFCGLVLAEEIIRGKKADSITLFLIVFYPALLIIFGAAFIFLDPLKELIVIHLPFGKEYGMSPWPWLFVGLIPLSIILTGYTNRRKIMKPVWAKVSGATICLLGTLLVLQFSYNRKNAAFFHIEKLAIDKDWEGVLNYTGQHPSGNLFGSFYTNLALLKTGRLCTDLFRYPQSFGRQGLCFQWEAKGEVLRRGSDFFWTVNFVNEAHHWAFESMIVDGFTRRNLERLIETELVRGNLKVAEKYIELLGSAMFHRKMAAHYSQFLTNRIAMEKDPELGPVMRTDMKHDFFSEGMDLEMNLRLLLSDNPSNRPAYDYLMALLLLEKEVDEIASLLPGYQEAHDGMRPVLLDETLLVYKITHKEEKLPNIRVSPNTLQRFEEYTRILRQYRDPREAARMLYPDYQNSFWFYLNFSSITNRSL